MKKRCKWAEASEIEKQYHDEEWGVPLHDDQKLFEFLMLDAFQAGLSWRIILQKRENFRKAFDGFDAEKIASYDQEKIASLMLDKGIVRNRRKIDACIQNAKAYLKIKEEYTSFDEYIWSFTGGRIIQNAWEKHEDVPAKTKESDAMSKDLKKKGFAFTGSTICYAFMQACGMVNDHTTDCFRYEELKSF